MSRNFTWKKTATSIFFVTFLIGFEVWLFKANYYGFLKNAAPFGPDVPRQILLAYSVTFIITTLFVWASLVSRYQFKVIYFVIFAFAILIEYGYQNAFQTWMTLDDLDNALTTDIWDWGTPALAYINWYALIPITLYALMLVSQNIRNTSKSSFSYSTNLVLLVPTLCIPLFVHSGFFFFGFPRSNVFAPEAKLGGGAQIYQTPTVSLQAFFDLITRATLREWIIYSGPRDKIPFQAQSQPQNNVIFIIDETVRADHLSLNGYSRPTTPYLEQLASNKVLYNWGAAVSSGTCSNQSSAMLMTGVRNLPDTEFRIKRNPTIFQYAKAMNYKTFYFEGQSSRPRFGFTYSDFEYVDKWLNKNDFGNDYDTDTRIAKKVADVLSTSPSGNFILIFKRGFHFPYDRSFPKNEVGTVWAPILTGVNQVYATDQDHYHALINSYDNGIRYNLDNFFQTILQKTNSSSLNNSVFVYTGDHGETLGDFGETNPHCGDTKNEALVPLFILSPHNSYKVDERYKASHHNIFATLLDLMSFPESERHYNYAKSLLKAKASDSEDRIYFYGSLFGLGDYKLINFDKTALGQNQAGPINRPLVTIETTLIGPVGIKPVLQTAPWGIEIYKDDSLLWLGQGENQGLGGTLWAAEKRLVQVVFKVEPGPARSNPKRTVELSLSNAAGTQTVRQQFDQPTDLAFTGQLQVGPNQFSFQVLDEPTILQQPDGETRPLLVLLRHVTIKPE